MPRCVFRVCTLGRIGRGMDLGKTEEKGEGRRQERRWHGGRPINTVWS